jgi:hypothetical protein
MLKLAIIRMIPDENGDFDGRRFRVILEGEDGEFKRELASRIRRLLGAKKSFNHAEIAGAVDAAFEQYKSEFKEKTVTLP